MPAFTQIAPDIFMWSDTCNVFVVRDGDAAMLIDLGDGSVLDALGEIGVRRVEWVLFTHHHREQCQGAGKLAALDAKVAVGAAERALFEHRPRPQLSPSSADTSHRVAYSAWTHSGTGGPGRPAIRRRSDPAHGQTSRRCECDARSAPHCVRHHSRRSPSRRTVRCHRLGRRSTAGYSEVGCETGILKLLANRRRVTP